MISPSFFLFPIMLTGVAIGVGIYAYRRYPENAPIMGGIIFVFCMLCLKYVAEMIHTINMGG